MQVGRFTITGELARHATGIVYSARDGEREVALTALDLRDERARRRFAREVEALTQLTPHPGVVPILAAGEHQGMPWIATDCVRGPSLQDRLDRDGPLRSREAVRLGLALANALSHVHQWRLLHRDLKPAHVLLTEENEPRLAGLGTGSVVGSPGYWPPELALGRDDEVDAASDVYALGATLFAAVTGRPPLTADSLPAALHAVEHVIPARPSTLVRGLDPRLEAVILRCLEKDPTRRYTTPDDLADALEACRTRDEPVRQPVRGYSITAAVALAIVAVVNVTAVVVFASRRATPPETRTATPARPPAPDPPPPRPDLPPPPPKTPPPPPPPRLFLKHPARMGTPVRGRKPPPLADRPAWIVALERKLRVAPGSIDVDGSTVDLSAAEYAALEESPAARRERLSEPPPADPARGEFDALMKRSAARESVGDLQGSTADLEAAVALRPDPTAFERLGGMRLRLKDRAGALRAYDAGIELAPSHVELRYGRGSTRLMVGDAAGAREDLDVLVAQSPRDADALLLRARASRLLDDRAAAIADLRATLAVARPGSRTAAEAEMALAELGVAPR